MASIRVAPTRAARALNLLRTVQYTHPPNCPCHSNPSHHHHMNPLAISQSRRALATPIDHAQQKEYAFEMAASSIRFGPGCTKEVGMDMKNLGARKVMVVTDSTVKNLNAMKQVQEGLDREGVPYEVYDKCRVEPKDYSYVSRLPFAAGRYTDGLKVLRRLSRSRSHTRRTLSLQSEVALSLILPS